MSIPVRDLPDVLTLLGDARHGALRVVSARMPAGVPIRPTQPLLTDLRARSRRARRSTGPRIDLDWTPSRVTVSAVERVARDLVRCIYSASVGSRRAPRVLVDEPAQPIVPDDLPGRADGLSAGKRRAQVERSVRPGRVVVLDELA